jgi:Sec-independent protein secretion pathway component TatC
VSKSIEAALRTAVYGSMAAAAFVAAFLFLVIAAFLWTQQRYDTIVACGAGAGLFLLVAIIALAILANSRRRAAKAEAAAVNTAPAWLADPAILLMAVQVARSIGITRLLPLALAAITAFGAADLMKGRARMSKRRAQPDESKRAA